jgi:lipopolysaccharide biosynthesis glycosyltransferase
MNILLSFNEAYASHAAAVITGLICHSSQKLSIFVLHQNVTEETINKFEQYYSGRLKSIKFIKAELPPEIESRLKGADTEFHLKGNLECWLRLFSPSFIEEDYVIWLDCDIVVTGDICRMLDEVDNSYYIAACKEYDPLYKLRRLDSLDRLNEPEDWKEHSIRDAHYYRTYKYYGIPHDVSYFCTGIMYINLKKWREDHLEKEILKNLNDYDYFFAVDQDLLNSVLKGRFCILSPKWNTLILSRGCEANYDSASLQEAKDNPYIVHLTGLGKPWNEQMGGVYRKLYWEYRLDTPWPAKPNWKRCLKNKYIVVERLARAIFWLKKTFGAKKNYQTDKAISFFARD